jgi:hypothetical protein
MTFSQRANHRACSLCLQKIQIAIYEKVLIHPGALVVDGMAQDVDPRHDLLWDYLTPAHLAITQSCYSLRDFTSRIFYSRNTFHVKLSSLDVGHLRRLELWYLGMGHEKRFCIRAMRVFGQERSCQRWRSFQDAMRSIIAHDHRVAHFAVEQGYWKTRRGCDDFGCYRTPCDQGRLHMASALEKPFLTEEDFADAGTAN